VLEEIKKKRFYEEMEQLEKAKIDSGFGFYKYAKNVINTKKELCQKFLELVDSFAVKIALPTDKEFVDRIDECNAYIKVN